jgi:hypothetical protein
MTYLSVDVKDLDKDKGRECNGHYVCIRVIEHENGEHYDN